MITVKLTYPKNWLKHGHWDYLNLTPGNQGVWKDYRFEVNNQTTECDFWVVHESVDNKETARCPYSNVFLITSEEKTQIPEYPIKYLQQFGNIITSRDDIRHLSVIRTHYLCPWWVKKTYDELIYFDNLLKDEVISTITSDNTSAEGHKKRYAFVNRLKGHFKDKLHWFGKGERVIDDKWQGLVPYKYSIAIENSSHPYYFTEKLTDCFLAYTMPVYWGCSNIMSFFPEKSMILIDRDNFQEAIQVIEKAIEENLYEKNFNLLKKARELTLNTYNFIPALTNILSSFSTQKPKNKININPKDQFIGEKVYQKINRKISRAFFYEGFSN